MVRLFVIRFLFVCQFLRTLLVKLVASFCLVVRCFDFVSCQSVSQAISFSFYLFLFICQSVFVMTLVVCFVPAFVCLFFMFVTQSISYLVSHSFSQSESNLVS